MSSKLSPRAAKKKVDYAESTEGDSVMPDISVTSGATSVYCPPSSYEDDDSVEVAQAKKTQERTRQTTIQ